MINFAIIGAQKAATSSLHNAIRLDPQVYMPRGESPIFEDPEFSLGLWDKIGDDRGKGLICGIKRPNILCSDIMRERVLSTHPDLRVIVVLRDPISRSISAYYHLVRHAELPLLSLNDGMKRCIRHFKDDRKDLASLIIEDSLYGHHLLQWRKALGAERMLTLSQMQVSGNPEDTLRRSLQHIGAGYGDTSFSRRAAASVIGEKNVGMYNFSFIKYARIASLIRTRPIKGMERRVPRAFPLRIAGGALARVTEEFSKHVPSRPESLSEEILSQMSEIFEKDYRILKNLVPREVLYWRKSTGT